MDRRRLCEALSAAGVPAGLYEIADCPGSLGGPRPEDRLYLEEQAGEWVVGVQQCWSVSLTRTGPAVASTPS